MLRLLVPILSLAALVIGTSIVHEYSNLIMHNFVLDIQKGDSECFYQDMTPGYRVIIIVHVKDKESATVQVTIQSDRDIVVNKNSINKLEHNENKTAGGLYEICVHNNNRLASRYKVYFFIGCYMEESWDKYNQELVALNIRMENFTSTISSVEERLFTIRQYTRPDFDVIMKDHALMIKNGDYITYWSVTQCFAIVCASALQVYMLRRLFKN